MGGGGPRLALVRESGNLHQPPMERARQGEYAVSTPQWWKDRAECLTCSLAGPFDPCES